MKPVCQLEEYLLTRLHLDFNPPPKDEVRINQVKSAFDYSLGVHSKEVRRYRFDLHVKCYEADEEEIKVGYEVEAAITGFFSLDEEVPKEKMEVLVRLNSFSILYGMLRGIVATASGSFPGGKFLLPAVMPQDIVELVERAKKEEAEKVSRSSKTGNAKKRALPK